MNYFKFERNEQGKLDIKLDCKSIGEYGFYMFETFGFPIEMFLEEILSRPIEWWRQRHFSEFINYTEEHKEEFKQSEDKWQKMSNEEKQPFINSGKKVWNDNGYQLS